MTARNLAVETNPMAEKCEHAAALLKTLAHPQRLLILCYLIEGAKTVSELEKLCGASQSAVSHFLTRMRAERLVSAKRDGNFVYYTITDPNTKAMIKALHKIFCP